MRRAAQQPDPSVVVVTTASTRLDRHKNKAACGAHLPASDKGSQQGAQQEDSGLEEGHGEGVKQTEGGRQLWTDWLT